MKKKKTKISKNVEVEDVDVFIKVSPEDSLEAKREMLEMKEALIETQIASEKFKMQRKEEMLRRQDAKKTIKETLHALNTMMSELPKDIKIKIKEEKKEMPPKPRLIKPLPQVELIRPAPVIIKKEEIRPTKIGDLQRELENIKAKLGKLG
jgi:exonuclease VII large subunit